MNFRDFYVNRSEQQNKKVFIEDQLNEELEDEGTGEDEYYEEPEEEPEYEEPEYEDDYYEPEPSKVIPQTPIQRKVKHQPTRPIMKQQRQISQPVYRSRPIQRQAMPIEQYNRPIQINKKQLSEDTIEGTACSLTEALKRKVDTIFYRFGIQGLEKLDEKILDTIEELQYPEPRPIKKIGGNMRRVPARRIIKKQKPLPLQDIKPAPIYEEPEEIYEEQTAPVYEEEVMEQEPVQQIVEEQQPQELVQEPVQEPVQEEVIEEKAEEPQASNMFDIANQLLDIEPEKELKHEPNGSNPVFAPQMSAPAPVAEQVNNMAFEIPPVENKLVTMPSLDEFMQQEAPTQVEQVPDEVPQTKKPRKSKKKEEENN